MKPRGFIRKQYLETDLQETFNVLCDVFQNYLDQIPLKDNKKTIIVKPEERMYLRSEGHYVQIYCYT